MNIRAIQSAVSTLGVLLVLAGVFELMRWNIALFSGVVCFIIAGALPTMLSKGGPG